MKKKNEIIGCLVFTLYRKLSRYLSFSLHTIFQLFAFSNLTGQYYSGISFLTNLRLRVQAPVCSIAHAAGFDYSVVVEKLLEQDNPDLGYDPAKGLFLISKNRNKDLRVILCCSQCALSWVRLLSS